jgi:hypothetical protein
MSIYAETEWEMNNGLFQKNTSYKVSILSWNTPSVLINKVLMQNVAFIYERYPHLFTVLLKISKIVLIKYFF